MYLNSNEHLHVHNVEKDLLTYISYYYLIAALRKLSIAP